MVIVNSAKPHLKSIIPASGQQLRDDTDRGRRLRIGFYIVSTMWRYLVSMCEVLHGAHVTWVFQRSSFSQCLIAGDS